MDRTIIAVQRAEERDLSEKLYRKLRGLGILHPPTDDLRRCLSEEMFIKPNPQAFFHVMHYIFCLLDATEFKKRFYWPITDKRSEANFRTSTVEYLKYLNEKHKLHWGDIKSYLVVMPGGKKFITFLLDFVTFVVQEQIRHREKLLGADVESGHAADLNLKRMRKQNAFFKDYASAYISNVDEQIVQLRDKTQQLNNILETLAQEVGKSKAQLSNEQFLVMYEKSNMELYQNTFAKGFNMVRKLEEPLVNLKQLIEKFQLKEAELKIDKGRVRQAVQKIGDATNAENSKTRLHPNSNSMDDVKLYELMITFNIIQPVLENAFTEVEHSRSCSELVIEELSTLKNEYQQLEKQITGFQMFLNSQIKKRCNQRNQTPSESNEDCSSLMLKYVCTPPIKLETLNGARIDNMRLPLFVDVQGKFISDSFCGNVSVLQRSARKYTSKNTSVDMNNTMNKSRIIDSVQLLRTIHKGTARAQRKTVHNTTSCSTTLLSTSWRERQNIFHNDLESEPVLLIHKTANPNNISGNHINSIERTADMDTSKAHLDGQQRVSTSPYTPFNSNDRTRIARNQLLEAISSSSGSGGTKAKVFLSRRLSAVQKVQGDCLNIANMSTSPSGRLDPLVPPPIECNETPRLKLNDITMQENTFFVDKSDEHVTAVQLVELSTRCVLLSEEPGRPELNCENNGPECAQTSKCPLPIQLIGDDDDLFNISDTVLKDITM